MSALLSLEEAQARLLTIAPQPKLETVPVGAALGRYLLQDLHANRSQPASDLSAMDGYAVAGAGPWERVGESRAGAPFAGTLQTGQCVRISTGAHMPDGSDRVLIQEDAEVNGARVSALDTPDSGQHVRRKGFDFAFGDKVLHAGTRIGPAQIALALSAGHNTLSVGKALRVAILDSGDELSVDAENCATHEIPASNGAMIEAMLAPMGSEVKRIGPVADDMEALLSALDAAADVDLLITSGGASVGDHDLVQDALREWGAEIDFWKVAIKPGKPLMIAKRDTQVIIGLPGNPVSSFVTCFLFALPLIRAIMGAEAPLPEPVMATLTEPLEATGSRREFVRGVINAEGVRIAGSQDSSALASLAAANCLIDRPAHSPEAPTGTQVVLYHLQNG